MVVANTVRKRCGKSLLMDTFKQRSKLPDIGVQETILIVVDGTRREKIRSGRTDLLAAWHEDQSRLIGRELQNRLVGRASHRKHGGREVRDGERLKVELKRNRTGMRAEVVDGVLIGTDPLSDIPSIRERHAKTNNAHFTFSLESDIVHARHDHFVNVSSIATEQV